MFIDDRVVRRKYKKISRADPTRDWLLSIESALLASEWGRSESVRIRFDDKAVVPSITNHFTEIIRMQMHRTDDVAGIFTACSLASLGKDRAKKISWKTRSDISMESLL